MRSTSAQLVKEARQLAWPWTILLLTAFFVLVRPSLGGSVSSHTWEWMLESVLPIGTFVGSAVLAVLPLGSEFQFRTLAMRFAQPIARGDLWRQKFLVSLVAVLPPALLFCTVIYGRYGRAFTLMTAGWILMTIAGAIPFTLIARSTIGGIMLNALATTGVSLTWMYYEKHGAIPALWLVLLLSGLSAYAVMMIALGRRMFLRFQAADGMQAAETFVPGARFVPAAVADCFRPRSTQPILNLLRREFHLMRMLWPMAALNLAAWIFLVAFHHLPTNHPEGPHVVFVLTMILGFLMAVLAGTLSLGEEKAWGTHDWHMTLPVSVSAQWTAKLLFALGASLVTTALLPMSVLVVGKWLGAPWEIFSSSIALVWIAEVLGITFVAFWSACIVRNTIQAVLWIFPLCFAVGFAVDAPSLLVNAVPSVWKLFGSIVWHLDPFALGRSLSRLFFLFESNDGLIFVAVLLAGIALIQTRRLFDAQVAANRLRVLRCAVAPMLVGFLCGAVGIAFYGLLTHTWRQANTVLHDTDAAIVALQATGSHSQRFTSADLIRTAKLSERTQLWLRDATITVASAPELTQNGPGRHLPGRVLFGVPKDEMPGRLPYSAVIRTAQGSQCSLMFQVQREHNIGYVSAICQ